MIRNGMNGLERVKATSNSCENDMFPPSECMLTAVNATEHSSVLMFVAILLWALILLDWFIDMYVYYTRQNVLMAVLWIIFHLFGMLTCGEERGRVYQIMRTVTNLMIWSFQYVVRGLHDPPNKIHSDNWPHSLRNSVFRFLILVE